MFLNRRAGEESDGDSPRDMSSDGSNDCRDLSQNLYRVSLEEKPFIGSSSDESEVSSNSPGDLVFEYLEAAMPFGREPLTDKASLYISASTCNKNGSASINILYSQCVKFYRRSVLSYNYVQP